jgi:WD40 repeat protein
MLACRAGERIVFWDIERRQRRGESIAYNGGFVTSLAFSPDGRWLGSGGYDDSAILWRLRPDVWQRQACAIANRNLDETRMETANRREPGVPEVVPVVEEVLK